MVAAFGGGILASLLAPLPALAAHHGAKSNRPAAAAEVPQAPADAPLALPGMPAPPQLPEVASYVLMDAATGTIIAEKAPTATRPPASLTKLMTAYLTYQAVAHGTLKLDQAVPVSVAAWRAGGSRMFISPDMSVTVDQLLHGLIIDSGNDAAVALAEAAAGTQPAFVQRMNAAAAKLGLSGTHYSNVSGLPHPDLHTTARDIATLSRAIIRRYPQFLKISAEKSYTFDKIVQRSWNPVLFHDPSVDGLKTGYTDAAGHCIAATALRDGRRLIAVELGGPRWSTGTAAIEALLDYGYRFYTDVTVATVGKPVGVLTNASLEPETVSVGAANDVVLTVPAQEVTSLKTALQLDADPPPSLPKGSKVGRITISLDGNAVATVPAITLTGAKPAGLVTRLVRSLRNTL